MKLRYFLVFLVSLISLIILARQFNWADLQNSLHHVNMYWLVPGIFMYLVSIFLRAVRWRVMIRTIKPIPISRLFQYVTIGFMTNNLLPARLGEVARAYITGMRENTSRSAMFASIVLERIFDGITIVLLLIATLFLSGLSHRLLMHVAWVSAAVFVAGIGFLILLTYRRDTALSLAARIMFFLPETLREKIMHILEKFVRGLVLLHHPGAILETLILSFAVWGAEFSVYVIFAEAFPFIDVSVKVLMIALVFVNLSSMLPALPANALVFQVACSQALIIFGHAQQTEALLYSVILHATQIFPVILIGYVFMGLLGLTWSDIRHMELEEDTD